MEDLGLEAPVAYLCSSKVGIDVLVEASGKLSKGSNFLLMLKNNDGLVKRLAPAYINASIRQKESAMKAKTLPMEILLFASGTLRTDKAIKECGASEKKGFILFGSSKRLLEGFARKMKVKLIKEYSLQLDLDVAREVASVGLLED